MTAPSVHSPLDDQSRALRAQLIEAQASVLLKREGWKTYHPVTVGSELYQPDLLQPTLGAKARLVYCQDEQSKTFKTVRLPDNQISSLNTYTYRPPRIIQGLRGTTTTPIIAPRSGGSLVIPYVISPRATALLNPRPRLRWNSVAKASRYHVWIETNGQKVWEAETKTTELVYPGDPPLQPGINYCLEVATDIQTFSSPKGPEPHLQFQILPPDQAQPIQSNLESLANQRLSAEALGLAQVFCYRSFELRAEAIETLEALITASCKIPAVYRSLANLYQETRLLTLAKEPYLTGVALAQAQEDLETEALISAELGWIYYQTGHGEEAKSWWNRAQEKFLQLGAPMGEQEVAAWLSRL